MKLKDKIYAMIAVMAIAISMILITRFAYSCGVNDGEYTGYHTGYDKGYSVGYDDGHWDGMRKGKKDEVERTNRILKYSGDTWHGFEQKIDGITYKVTVEKVDK